MKKRGEIFSLKIEERDFRFVKGFLSQTLCRVQAYLKRHSEFPYLPHPMVWSAACDANNQVDHRHLHLSTLPKRSERSWFVKRGRRTYYPKIPQNEEWVCLRPEPYLTFRRRRLYARHEHHPGRRMTDDGTFLQCRRFLHL